MKKTFKKKKKEKKTKTNTKQFVAFVFAFILPSGISIWELIFLYDIVR